MALFPRPFDLFGDDEEEEVQPSPFQTPVYQDNPFTVPEIIPLEDRQETGIGFSDYLSKIAAGGASLVQGIGWVAKKLGSEDVGGAIEELGSDAVDYWNEQLSTEARESAAKEFVHQDPVTGDYSFGDADINTIGLMAAESLLGTAAGMGLGAGITKVLQVFANPKGRGVLAAAVNLGARSGASVDEVAKGLAAAKKMNVIDSVLGATGFGLGEGIISGMATGSQVESEILDMSHESLLKSERYQMAYQGMTDLGFGEQEMRDYARATVAEDAAMQASWRALGTTAILSAPTGALFGKLLGNLKRNLAATRLKSVAAGAGAEAGQEFAQSGVEQLVQNIAIKEYADPERKLSKGVVEAAVSGAVVGAGLGGVVGGATFQKPEVKAEEPTDLAGQVAAAGREAATAPETVGEPSDAQIEVGNYRKGHQRIEGLDISIENPVGSVRSGTDANGKPWSITMANPYGYIRGTEGSDGDQVDITIGATIGEGNKDKAYIVDQLNKDGSFDEHKLVIGADTVEDAEQIYLSNYEKGWDQYAEVTALSTTDLKQWLKEGDQTQPYAGEDVTAGPAAGPELAPAEPAEEVTEDLLFSKTEKEEFKSAEEKGLPMDKDSRLERAREMGFDTDTVLYHGTKEDISAFLSKGVKRVSAGGQLSKGRINLTSDPKIASIYATEIAQGKGLPKKPSDQQAERYFRELGMDEVADHINRYGYKELVHRSADPVGGNIIPLYIRGSIKTVDASEAKIMAPGGFGWFAKEENTAKAEGFDGVEFENVPDRFPHDKGKLVVFDPNLIRSINAAFDPEYAQEADLLLSKQAKPTFKSGLAIAVGNLKQLKGSPTQMLATIKKSPGVKQEEIEAVDLEEFIRAAGKSVTKEQIQEFVEANGVQVETVELGQEGGDVTGIFDTEDELLDWIGDDPMLVDGEGILKEGLEVSQDTEGRWHLLDHKGPGGDTTKFGDQPSLQMPGEKDNYREVLLTLPATQFDAKELRLARDELAQHENSYNAETDFYDQDAEQPTPWAVKAKELRSKVLDLEKGTAAERKPSGAAGRRDEYTGGHFDQPNVLLHLRVNDRTGPNGEKILFLEEIQSDLHQRGRREGYAVKGTPAQDALTAFQQKMRIKYTYPDGEPIDGFSIERAGGTQDEINTFKELQGEAVNEGIDKPDRVPDFPFKGNAWVELGLKKAIRMASEEGYDAIAWTPGQIQADRYDLSKQVKDVYLENPVWENGNIVRGQVVATDHNGVDVITKDITSKAELEEIIGKEPASKLLADDAYQSRDRQMISGPDLKVGGEGMISFYDRLVPNLMKKVARKLDKSAQLGDIQIGPPRVKDDLAKKYDLPEDRGQWSINVLREAGATQEETEAWWDDKPEIPDYIQFLPLTEKITAGAMEGQLLFTKGGEIVEKGSPQAKTVEIRESLQSAIEQVSSAVQVEVVHDRTELPFNAKQIDETTEGVYDRRAKKVYLIGSQIKSVDRAAEVFLHETFGHAAMEDFPEYAGILSDLQTQLRTEPGELQPFLDAVTAADSTLSELVRAKEVVAKVAEGGTKTTLYGRLRASTRQLLRKLGFNQQIDEADIRALISRAARKFGDGSTIVAPTLFHVNQIEVLDAREPPEDPYTVDIQGDKTFFDRIWDNELLRSDLLTHVPGAVIGPDGFTFDTSEIPGVEVWVEHLANNTGMKLPKSMRDGSFVESIQPKDTRYLFSKRGSISSEFEAIAGQVSDIPPEDQNLLYAVKKLHARWKAYDMRGNWMQGIFDGAYSLDRYERTQSDGDLLKAVDSPLKAIRAIKSVSGQMEAYMEYGALHYNDKAGSFDIVPGRLGGHEIFGKLRDNDGKSLIYNWGIWKAAIRASRLIKETNPDGTSKEKNFTQDQIDTVLHEVESSPYKDLFQQVSDEYQESLDQMLDEAVRIGSMNSDMREAWRTNDYVPFYRALEIVISDTFAGTDPQAAGMLGKKSIDGKSVRSRKLTGGQEKIQGAMFENIMMNFAYIQDTMNKHLAMKKLTEIADGIVIKKVKMKVSPNHFTNEQLAAPLIEAGLINETSDVASMSQEDKQKWQTLFSYSAPMGNDIISVLEDGKMAYYQINDPLMMRSIQSIGVRSFDNVVINVMGWAKNLLTQSITAGPEFMVANLARDTLQTFVVSNQKMIPFVDAARGFMQSLANDPLKYRLMAAGAPGGGFYNQEDIRKIIMQKVPGNKVESFMRTIVHPNSRNSLWQSLQKIGTASENANRLAIANAILKQDPNALGEAAYESRDILDFGMEGDFQAIRVLNATVPFMRARINGLYRLYRGAKENPMSFAAKGAIVMAASIALWYKNKDDERYQELHEWDKDTYWHFFTSEKGDAGHYRFPKPFESGAIFGTIPERMMQQLYEKEDMGLFADRMGAMILETFNFNPVPQAVKPLLEQYMNKSFFTKTPIIGLGDEHRLLPMQYNYRTSATFREWAKAMPEWAPSWLRSPKRLEALYRGYTGTMGMYLLSATDGITRELAGYPERPTLKIWDRPIAGRFTRDPNPFSNKYQGQLYEMLNEANGLNLSIKSLREQGEPQEAAELRIESRDKLAVRKRLGAIARRIATINKGIRRVYMDPNLSGDQKWERVNSLKIRKVRILRQVAQYADRF